MTPGQTTPNGPGKIINPDRSDIRGRNITHKADLTGFSPVKWLSPGLIPMVL